MPDKKDRQPVTDQALLDQLNSDTTPEQKPIADQVDEALSGKLPIDKRNFVMAQLRHETGRPKLDSPVAIKNNNVSGITWNENFPEDWKGTPRPSEEGGYYVHFPTYGDWSDEYLKLLKKDKGSGAPLDATSIEDYAHRLKKNGYYTAPESVYVNGMKQMHQLYGHQQEEVTDPQLLRQLNGDTDPQKKSPDVSAGGLEQNPPISQNGVSGNNIPVGIAAPKTPNADGITQTDPNTGLPASFSSQDPQSAPDPKEKTSQATNFIASHYLANNAPGAGDISGDLNKLTDPHGDPTHLANYTQNALSKLEADHIQQNQDLLLQRGTDVMSEKQKLDENYQKQKADIQDNSKHIQSLQLFNKEYQDKRIDPAESQKQQSEIQNQYKSQIDPIDKQLEEVKKEIKSLGSSGIIKKQGESGLNQYELNQKFKDLTLQKEALTNQFSKQQQDIQSNTKYNSTEIGAEYAAMNGNPKAQQDLLDLKQGKSIEPTRKYQYDVQGGEIMNTGFQNVSDEKVKKQVAPFIDQTGERLFQNNKQYFVDQLANARYQDESAWRWLIPSGKWTPEKVQEYGEKKGLTQSQIDELKKNPDEIPKSATAWQQFLKGVASTTVTPIHEQIAKTIGRIGGVPSEMMNKDFRPGWEDERGVSSVISGRMPSEQNSFGNWRGGVGQVLNGIGSLVGLTGEVGAVGKGMEAMAGVDDASKLANFGVMAFNGYNDAYHTSLDVIGDKPEDENARQMYSLANGILGGAIFSINPKTNIITQALGKESSAGKEFITGLQKKGIDFIKSPEGEGKALNYVKEYFKENGVQVGLAEAQKITEDITNTIANPDKQQNVGDDIKNTALTTIATMAIPSLFSAHNHIKSQTPLNSATHFEIGSNPTPYVDEVNNMLNDGKITPAQAQSYHDAILTMKNSINNTPAVNGDGKPLSPDQVKDYAYNLTQEHIIQGEVDKINQQAEATKTIPDKAQLEGLTKKISQLQKQRVDLLSNPIPHTLLVPKEEQNQAPADERSVATDGQSEKEARETKKSSEELENTEKEDISLTSQKKENDETGNEEISGQNGSQVSETTERRSETQVRQATSLEGEQERKDRELKPSPTEGSGTGQKEPVGKQPQPNAAKPERKRRSLKPEAKESVAPDILFPESKQTEVAGTPIIETPELQTQDLGKVKGQPESETEKQVKDATVNHPDKPADILTSDNPTGESFNEAKERFHKKFDDIISIAPNNTPVVVHSWELKLLKAVKELDGDWNNEKLPELHQKNGGTEPGDIFPLKIKDKDGNEKTIYFVRHGETDANVKDLQRPDAAALTGKGRQEAKDVADQLKAKGIKDIPTIITSDLPRAKETSDIIAKEFERKNLYRGEGGKMQKIQTDKYGDNVTYLTDNKVYANAFTLEEKGDGYAKSEGSKIVEHSIPNDARIKELSHHEYIKEASEFSGNKPNELTTEDKNKFNDNLRKDYDAIKINRIESVVPTEGKAGIVERGKEVSEYLILNKEILTEKTNQGTEPSTERRNEVPSEKKAETTKREKRILKPKKDANEISKGKEQEILPESGKPEHERTDTPREQTEKPEAESGDSDKRSEEGKKKVEKPELSTNERVAKKQEKLHQLTTEHNDLEGDIANLEGQLNSEYAKQKPDADFIDSIEKELSKKQHEIGVKKLQIKHKNREIEIQKGYSKSADNIRKLAEKQKKSSTGMIGSFPFLSPASGHAILSHAATLVEKIGNLHIAALRALEWAKEKFKDEKGIEQLTHRHIIDGLSPEIEPLRDEPIIKDRNHLDAAKGWLSDIENGDITYEEARDEILSSEVGDEYVPIQDKTKANVLNYIDWHLKDRDIHNGVTLREPEEKNKVIGDYQLQHSDHISRMLSGDTIEDVTGEKPLNDQQKESLSLELAQQDSQKMVSLMKYHFGTDPVDWGGKMIDQIDKIPEGDTQKRVSATIGLMDELRKERNRLEYELSKLPPEETERRAQINRTLTEIPKLISRAEYSYQTTQSNASATLNRGRTMRQLFTGEYAINKHADEVLGETKIKEKKEVQAQEAKTEVPENIAKEGVIRKEEDANKQIELAEKQQKAFAEKQANENKKSKNVIGKLKKLVERKAEAEKNKVVDMRKEAERKMGTTADKFIEQLKEKIKKSPC